MDAALHRKAQSNRSGHQKLAIWNPTGERVARTTITHTNLMLLAPVLV